MITLITKDKEYKKIYKKDEYIMYKVIIADDEEKICALLNSSILWDKLELELSCICHDGLELKKAVEREQPDILITDICMPGMNAIDLIRDMREKDNQAKILIVSGYRQFEYAREALKYGVDNYLLKPIDEDELNDALKKICLEISVEKNEILPDDAEKIRDTLQSFFLQDIKNNIDMIDNTSLYDINQKYYVEFKKGYFRVIYVKIDVAGRMDEKFNLRIIQKKIREKCMSSINRIHQDTIVSFVQGGCIFVVNYSPDKEPSIRQLAKSMLEDAKQATSLFSGLNVTVGVGPACLEISDILKSYGDSVDTVIYRIISGTNKVYFSEDMNLRHREYYLGENDRKSLSHIFELCNTELFSQKLEDIVRIERKDVLILYKILKECVQLFYDTLNRDRLEGSDNIIVAKEILYDMDNTLTVIELVSIVEKSICALMRRILEERKQKGYKPVREAKEYVKKNYASKIKLEDVASEVALSPAYFSSIFSKEEGMTFVDWVNEYRIEKAKEILRKGDCTVAQTCEMVGISNQRYFSKLFKNKVGVKPMEYRKLYN